VCIFAKIRSKKKEKRENIRMLTSTGVGGEITRGRAALAISAGNGCFAVC
jgi:hypothetical protein